MKGKRGVGGKKDWRGGKNPTITQIACRLGNRQGVYPVLEKKWLKPHHIYFSIADERLCIVLHLYTSYHVFSLCWQLDTMKL